MFDTTGFMPHGHCYLWQPSLLWTLVASDLLIGLSYVVISGALLLLVRRIRIAFSGTFLAFGLFIAACGAGHFFDVVTIWHPAYWVTALIRGVTAVASVATAIWIFPLIPRVVKAIEAKEVEEQFETTRERLELLVRGVKDYAIFMLDRDGRVASWNEGAARISGHSEQEIIGKPLSTFYLPEDALRGLHETSLRQAVEQGHVEGEGWRLRKDGTRFYANYVLTALKGSDGRVRGYAKVTRDMTEKKNAEDQLRKAYEELDVRVRERTEELRASSDRLLASQREFQELVNTVDGIVWEADVGKPRFTFVSRQAEQVVGFPVERWLSEEGFWQKLLHPEDRARMTGHAYLSSTEKRDLRHEYRIQTADGRIIWVCDHVKVIHEEGKPSKLRGIMVDITAQKRVEDELRSTQEIAVRASTVKSEFLANMSHEIRTPLNAIIGMSTIGLDTTPDEQKECLATIKTAADSLLSLISEILDFSKIEAGKVELELSDFDLVLVSRNALDVISPLAKTKKITVDFDIDSSLPFWVTGDSGRLLQVLLNLLSNAVKFTPQDGKVNLSIKRVAYRSDGENCWARFEVADTGPGVVEEAKGRLFQPFVQADNSTARKYGGTGLGLSICKHLVELMKGRIGMESQPSKGSTFWFEIPIRTAASRPTPSPDEGAVAPSPERKSRSARILIAEDNPANQKVIQRFLEKLGHRAEIVADGKEALQSYQSGTFDLVFMDCQMPEMDGYEATRRIRELEKKSSKSAIPIIALTAHALSGDEKKCREAGMNDYLCKPVSPKLLEETIYAWMAKTPHGARAQSTTPAEPPPGVDLAYIEGLEALQAPGKPDIVLELIGCFNEASPEKIGAIERGIANRDTEKIRKEAHQFKSTCHSLGAKRLAALLNRLEESGGEIAPTELLTEIHAELRVVELQLAEIARKQALRP